MKKKSSVKRPAAAARARESSPSLKAVTQRIAGIKARRGYVIPSHAVLAIAAPDLLDAYEGVYGAITYTTRRLTAFEKNFVWLLVIICAETPTGAHHVKDFLDAGGTAAQLDAAAHLGMIAAGVKSLELVGGSWTSVAPGFTANDAYDRAIDICVNAAALPRGLVEIALVAGQACRKNWDKVALHLSRAGEAGMSEDAIAEALTVVILPAGNPLFVQACSLWLRLIRENKFKASPAYQYVANLP